MMTHPNDYLCALDDIDLELLELLKSHIVKRKQYKKKAAISLDEYAEEYYPEEEEYPEEETSATQKVGAVFLPMPQEETNRPAIKRFLARIR